MKTKFKSYSKINTDLKVVGYLKKHKIQTRPVYAEINKTNIYYTDNTLPNSNYVCTKGLFLPSYITLTNDEILYICKAQPTVCVLALNNYTGPYSARL